MHTEGPNSSVFLEHLFRRQSGRILSWLAGLLGPQHLQLAEDAVQECMLRAVQRWALEGIPERPEAWLFRVAHNYAISAIRKNRVLVPDGDELIHLLESGRQCFDQVELEEQLRDDELRMIFICCHPQLPEESQIALSLKLICGFSVAEIARVFFAEESTIAQRLIRAKKLIREKHLALQLPHKADWTRRLDSVIRVLYLMFSGGYSPLGGDELLRNDICMEALRLGCLVAESSVSSPRVEAMVALMSLQAARFNSRLNSSGEMILLEDQDRTLWDQDLIAQGFIYFDRSIARDSFTEMHLQAAIAAAYIAAPSAEEIPWSMILDQYDQLLKMTNSPLVALNRVVAVLKVCGPQKALSELKSLDKERALEGYHLLFAVRGWVLDELGCYKEAEAAFRKALACPCSLPERGFLERRLAAILRFKESQD